MGCIGTNAPVCSCTGVNSDDLHGMKSTPAHQDRAPAPAPRISLLHFGDNLREQHPLPPGLQRAQTTATGQIRNCLNMPRDFDPMRPDWTNADADGWGYGKRCLWLANMLNQSPTSQRVSLAPAPPLICFGFSYAFTSKQREQYKGRSNHVKTKDRRPPLLWRFCLAYPQRFCKDFLLLANPYLLTCAAPIPAQNK